MSYLGGTSTPKAGKVAGKFHVLGHEPAREMQMLHPTLPAKQFQRTVIEVAHLRQMASSAEWVFKGRGRLSIVRLAMRFCTIFFVGAAILTLGGKALPSDWNTRHSSLLNMSAAGKLDFGRRPCLRPLEVEPAWILPTLRCLAVSAVSLRGWLIHCPPFARRLPSFAVHSGSDRIRSGSLETRTGEDVLRFRPALSQGAMPRVPWQC